MNILQSIILVVASVTNVNATEMSKTYQLYHSFDPSADFSPRGSITLASTVTSNGITASVENIDGSVNKDIADRIVEEGNGFYRIKVVDAVTGRSALASVPACEVRRANFREEIELTIGHTGSLLSLSYTPLVSPIAMPCHSLPNLATDPKFQTQISYSTSTAGMTIPAILPKTKPPPGFKSIPRSGSQGGSAGSQSSRNAGAPPFGDSEEERKARENQSFLRKYWYIILPLALSTFFSAEEPAASNGPRGGGGSGAGSSAASAGVAAAAVAGGAGNAVKERRGKRG